MNPNLTSCQTLSYKDILLRKLSYAVTCSVISQLVLLQIYVFLINFDPLHPHAWVKSTLSIWTSFSTFFYTIPFLCITFAQAVVCSKDYVVKSTYCSTRFRKFISVFSVHNLLLLLFHVVIGGVLIWIYLSLGRGEYRYLIDVCASNRYCLNPCTLYLIVSGFWTGFYYFFNIYISKKHLNFPVIQQRKFLQLKSQVRDILRDSVALSIWPTFFYLILYYIQSDIIVQTVSSMFGILINEEQQIDTILFSMYLILFTSLYIFSMSLMRFLFNLYLTEAVEFPLAKNDTSLTLQESIVNSNWPIVQNLACLDLNFLAKWSAMRRQVLFSLSQPGGHPHNWNSLIENTLKLFKEYNELLSKSTETNEKITPGNVKLDQPAKTDPVAFVKSPERYKYLRNMSLKDPMDYNFVNVSHTPLVDAEIIGETFMKKVQAKLSSWFNFVKVALGINFLFGELPQANIQKCLSDGQLVIWSSQAISDIVCASLTEDRYGIVQKDIPAIITSLVSLKQNLDKLNKLSAFSRKVVGYDEFNYRMKGAVTSSVKRSLFNICKTFGEFLNEFPLSKEVMMYLQVHIVCKS